MADKIQAAQFCGLGSPVDSGIMAKTVPTTEIDVTGVKRVRAAFQIASITDDVVLRMEAKIGDIWFPTGTDFTADADGGCQIYFECEDTVESIRLLWVSSTTGTPVVTYAVMVANND